MPQDYGAMDAFLEMLQTMFGAIGEGLTTSVADMRRLGQSIGNVASPVRMARETITQGIQGFDAEGFVSDLQNSFSSLSKVVDTFGDKLKAGSQALTELLAVPDKRQTIRQAFEPQPPKAFFEGVQSQQAAVPAWVYELSPMAGALQVRRGLVEGIRKETVIGPEEQRYYQPYFDIGQKLKEALGESDIRSLRRAMYVGGEPYRQYSVLGGEITRTQFARARTIQQLQQMQAPPELITQVQGSFDTQIARSLEKLNTQTSNALNKYVVAFQQIRTGTQALYEPDIAIMGPDAGSGAHFRQVQYPSPNLMGHVVRDLQENLMNLTRTALYPKYKEEAIQGAKTQVWTGVTEALTQLVPNLESLPGNIRASIERATATEQQFREAKVREKEILQRTRTVETQRTEARTEFEKGLTEFQNIDMQYQTERNRLRQMEEQAQARGGILSPREVGELRRQRERVQQLGERRSQALERVASADYHQQALEDLYKTLTTGLQRTRTTATGLQRRFTDQIRQFFEDLQSANLSELPKKQRTMIQQTAKEAAQALRRIDIMEGRATPTLRERFRYNVAEPVKQVGGMFLQQNAANLQMALMFGLSSVIFDALTRIPMETTYQTVQPIFTGAGALSGITPVFQEFQQFAFQAPQIMSDLQSRMNSMQALLGSRYYAESAVGKALEIARVQPIQFPEAMEILTAMAVYPSTKGRATNQQFQEQVFNSVQLLSMLAPEQGIGGALFAIREMLGGQFRSLQMRFNISPEVLASYANKPVSEFKGAPGAEKIEILNQALEAMFGGREILFRRGAQFDVQLRNIGDTLTSAVVLPMVRNIQPAFAGVIQNLLTTTPAAPGQQPQRTEDFTKSQLFSLLPESQAQMLNQLAIERTVRALAGTNEGAGMQYRRGMGLADVMREAVQRGISESQVTGIYRRQVTTLATQTYGTASGFLSLIATSLNTALGPIVQALGIGSGLGNLIASFGSKFTPRVTEFQAQLQTLEGQRGTLGEEAYQEQRTEAARKLIEAFTKALDEEVNKVKNKFASGPIRGLLQPITDVVREISMTAFQPIAETMLRQTVQTAVELPGTLIGRTVSNIVTAPFQTGAQPPSLAGTAQTILGLTAWAGLPLIQRGRYGTGAAMLIGGSLGQEAIQSLKGGEIGRFIFEGAGSIAAYMGVSKLTQKFGDLFKGMGGAFRKASEGAGSRILRYARGTRAAVAVAEESSLLTRGIPWVGAAIGAVQGGYQAYHGRYLEAGLSTLGGIASLAPMAMGGPAGLAIGALGALVATFSSSLADLIRAIVGAKDELESSKKVKEDTAATRQARTLREYYLETPIEEKRTAAQRTLEFLEKEYPVKKAMGEPNWEVYKKTYAAVETEPFAKAKQAYLAFEQSLQPKIEVQAEERVKKEGLTGEEAEAKKSRYVAETKQAMAQSFESLRNEYVQAVTNQRYGRNEQGEFTQEFRRKVELGVEKMFSAAGVKATDSELQQAVKAFIDSIKRGAQEVSNHNQRIGQIYQQNIVPLVRTKTFAESIYRQGYEAVRPFDRELLTNPERAPELKQRILEFTQNVSGMTQAMFKNQSLVDKMAMFGLISPREAMSARKQAGEVILGELRSGTLTPDVLRANFQDIITSLMAAGKLGEAQPLLRRLALSEMAMIRGDIGRAQEAARKAGLKPSDEGLAAAMSQSLSQVTENINKGGDAVYQSLLDLANRIDEVLTGTQNKQQEGQEKTPKEKEEQKVTPPTTSPQQEVKQPQKTREQTRQQIEQPRATQTTPPTARPDRDAYSQAASSVQQLQQQTQQAASAMTQVSQASGQAAQRLSQSTTEVAQAYSRPRRRSQQEPYLEVTYPGGRKEFISSSGQRFTDREVTNYKDLENQIKAPSGTEYYMFGGGQYAKITVGGSQAAETLTDKVANLAQGVGTALKPLQQIQPEIQQAIPETPPLLPSMSEDYFSSDDQSTHYNPDIIVAPLPETPPPIPAETKPMQIQESLQDTTRQGKEVAEINVKKLTVDTGQIGR